MTRIIAMVIATIFCVTACKKKPEDTIASINKKHEKINSKLPDYKFVQVDDIVSKEQGKIGGYFRDEEAKKIKTEYFGEKSRSFTEYYFDDGMLIYVESQDFIYNLPNTYTEEKARAAGDSVWYDDTKTTMEINRYYFSENKLIKWTGRGKDDVPKAIAEFTKREPEILAKAIVALKQLKSEKEEKDQEQEATSSFF